MEYQHWLREAISQLQASESPRRDAEILLEHVTGRGRTFILAFGETQLTDEQCQQLDALLTRRRDGEPIAHLTGVREFWSLPLFVSPATLIPRPDTECLVEQALAQTPAPELIYMANQSVPACVEASNGAIMFGDLNDPNSIVRRVLSKNFSIRRKPDLGTDPGVYYII